MKFVLNSTDCALFIQKSGMKLKQEFENSILILGKMIHASRLLDSRRLMKKALIELMGILVGLVVVDHVMKCCIPRLDFLARFLAAVGAGLLMNA